MKPLGRASYLAVSLATFASQHLVVATILAASHADVARLPWWFWLNPFHALVGPAIASGEPGATALALGMTVTLAVDAALVMLAFRRVRAINEGGWAAALTLVPVLQLLAIVSLAFAPTRAAPEEPARARARLDARTSALGVLVGVGAVVIVVTLSTLVLGIYGYALFLISPFFIALAVGYLANRGGPVGLGRTLGLVFTAFLLGGAALLGFAFEGVVCLVLATPVIAGAGVIGGALGAGLAGVGRKGRDTTLASVAFLPMLLVAEIVLPPRAMFDSVESVEVAAPASAVWEAVVRMRPIATEPEAPFRWGLAYPLRGEILGEGVGAVRRSVFSTGEAFERVTTWRPGAELAFAVLSEPPAMRELSPFLRVNAPHASGYFRTREVRFRLQPLPGGRTRLELTSRHDLDLEPALYWAPMAQWAVRANKRRVLAHMRAQAEAAVGPVSR